MSASDRDKVMVRGTKRSRDGIRVNRGVRSKAEIKNVCSMVVTIRNTCWMFDSISLVMGKKRTSVPPTSVVVEPSHPV